MKNNGLTGSIPDIKVKYQIECCSARKSSSVIQERFDVGHVDESGKFSISSTKGWVGNYTIVTDPFSATYGEYKYKSGDNGEHWIFFDVKNSKIFIHGRCKSKPSIRPFCYVLLRVKDS